MALQFEIIPVTPFEQNCSLIWCDQTNRGALIDPGGDLPRLLSKVAELDVELEKIILTHAHIDHAGAVGELSSGHSLPIEGPHKEDDFWIQMLPQQSQMFGFPKAQTFQPTRWLEQDDTVTVGNEVLEVLHCPGHTPGHVVFYYRPSGLLFVGDVLFQGSIGRTDFPKGDYDTLCKSIRGKLWPLGDEVRFVPGHGPMSTIGQEIKTNPFVGGYG
jgi:glyoxylase-like metal-dependent hydrolase (beta-lactamase superfamily II)